MSTVEGDDTTFKIYEFFMCFIILRLNYSLNAF